MLKYDHSLLYLQKKSVLLIYKYPGAVANRFSSEKKARKSKEKCKQRQEQAEKRLHCMKQEAGRTLDV